MEADKTNTLIAKMFPFKRAKKKKGYCRHPYYTDDIIADRSKWLLKMHKEDKWGCDVVVQSNLKWRDHFVKYTIKTQRRFFGLLRDRKGKRKMRFRRKVLKIFVAKRNDLPF